MPFGARSQVQFGHMAHNHARPRRDLTRHPTLQRCMDAVQAYLHRDYLTDREFAEWSGIGVRTVNRYKNRHTPPPQATVRLVAAECGVSLHWLETGEGPQWREASPELAELLRLARELPVADQAHLRTLARVLSHRDQASWRNMLIQLAIAIDEHIREGPAADRVVPRRSPPG